MKKILLIIFLTFSLSVQADVKVNHDKKTCTNSWYDVDTFNILKYKSCVKGYTIVAEIIHSDKFGGTYSKNYFKINDLIREFCDFNKQIIVNYPKNGKEGHFSVLCVFK